MVDFSITYERSLTVPTVNSKDSHP